MAPSCRQPIAAIVELFGIVGTFGTPAKVHRDVAGRIELHHRVRALVDDPEVVIAVVPRAVRVAEAVDPAADLARELPALVELEKLRRGVTVERARRRAARMVEDEHTT